MRWEDAVANIEFREQQTARERQRIAAAQQQYEQKKQYEDRLHARLRAIAFADVGASPAEQQRVELLMKQNNPEQFGNLDKIKVMVLTIRALTEAAQSGRKKEE
jgi:hypothetical protein